MLCLRFIKGAELNVDTFSFYLRDEKVYTFKSAPFISLVLYQDKRSRTGWVSTNQMRRNKCVRDVLTKRLEDIASDDGNVQSSYQEIRARLLDLIKEARTLNII